MTEAINFDDVQDARNSELLSDFLTPEPGDIDFIGSAPDPEIDTELLRTKEQTARSKKYQKKANVPARLAFRYALDKPALQPDAAAMLLYAPNITRAIGDLADQNETFRAWLDGSEDVIENPFINLAVAVAPFALQLLRNHEPQIENTQGIPIWRGKRILTKFKLTIRFGFLRPFTHAPHELAVNVFSNPKVVSELQRAGVIGNDPAEPEQPRTAPRKRAPRKATAPRGASND